MSFGNNGLRATTKSIGNLGVLLAHLKPLGGLFDNFKALHY